VEELVEPGELDPEHVHLPGIFVQRVVVVPESEKRIEKRTVALSAASATQSGSTGTAETTGAAGTTGTTGTTEQAGA
jgi:3-oxoacid CoA-transferase subunit A